MIENFKAFAKWILNFILLIIAIIFSLLIIKAWEGSANIAYLWKECTPEMQMGFMIAILFAWLYFLSILTRLIIWKPHAEN